MLTPLASDNISSTKLWLSSSWLLVNLLVLFESSIMRPVAVVAALIPSRIIIDEPNVGIIPLNKSMVINEESMITLHHASCTRA